VFKPGDALPRHALNIRRTPRQSAIGHPIASASALDRCVRTKSGAGRELEVHAPWRNVWWRDGKRHSTALVVTPEDVGDHREVFACLSGQWGWRVSTFQPWHRKLRAVEEPLNRIAMRSDGSNLKHDWLASSNRLTDGLVGDNRRNDRVPAKLRHAPAARAIGKSNSPATIIRSSEGPAENRITRRRPRRW